MARDRQETICKGDCQECTCYGPCACVCCCAPDGLTAERGPVGLDDWTPYGQRDGHAIIHFAVTTGDHGEAIILEYVTSDRAQDAPGCYLGRWELARID